MKERKNSKQRFDDNARRADIALLWAAGGMLSFLFFWMLWEASK